MTMCGRGWGRDLIWKTGKQDENGPEAHLDTVAGVVDMPTLRAVSDRSAEWPLPVETLSDRGAE
jgi:hypothetical protein